MRGTLAIRLQNYYLRSGNRIVFRNAMSLTEMSLEMWERLQFKEIDSSVLSRVLSGDRLFTCKQLHVFADIMHLSKADRQLLEEALMEDVMLRYGFHPVHDNVDMVSLLEKTISKIELFRSLSHADIVIEWTEDLHDYFRRNISDIESSPEALNLYINFIKLRIRSALEVRLSSSIKSFICQLSQELSTLGSAVHNESLINCGKATQAVLVYNDGDHLSAVPLLTESIKHELDDYDSVGLKRCLAISLVYSGRKHEYRRVKKELLEEIKTISPYLRCEALEGLAKSEIGLGNLKEAEKLFRKAEEALSGREKDKTEYGIVREIQLTRTLLQGVAKDKGFLSVRELEKRGLKALELAHIYGFERHEVQIDYLMHKLLL